MPRGAWWGGSGDGYTWPSSNHGLQISPRGNVWIGGNGKGDSHALKFTRNGEFLMQVGIPGRGVDNDSREHFARPAKISFAPDGEEAYVADGYGNRRVAVIDPSTGDFLRYWGAYGNEPKDVDPGPYDPDAPPADRLPHPPGAARSREERRDELSGANGKEQEEHKHPIAGAR
jgi:DNA-binding beta-propeller fold protein YncE